MQTLGSPDITRIAIFGTGECSRRVLAALRPRRADCGNVGQRSRAVGHREINGVQVVQPGAIPALACDYIVVLQCLGLRHRGPPRGDGRRTMRQEYLCTTRPINTTRCGFDELSILTRLIDMRAAARPSARGTSRAALDLSELERHRRYEAWREEARGRRLPGYFTARHAAVFDLLLGIQAVSRNVTGNLLEIGGMQRSQRGDVSCTRRSSERWS